MTAEQPPTVRTPLYRRTVFWLVMVIAVLVIALAVTAGVAFRSPGDTAPTAGTPAASDPPASTAEPTQEPTDPPATSTPSPTTRAVAIPGDCRNIYTKDWTPEMHGEVLNPAWSLEEQNANTGRAHDEQFATLLDATSEITCAWHGPYGGNDMMLRTDIARLTAEQFDGAVVHAQDLGWNCYEELGGTRCVTETAMTADGNNGYSYFFRDGIWISTRWTNLQPDGYTHDIVKALFGN
ncbi:hypothetical protein [Leifsonia sp. Leaf264]|uniref:hypothetical protein n=1 Tax=Leifsonia sp. Leaf264 TaxID=1736314 RepID=UPI0006FC2769|nr:hypothetical protein [Leifsonia sp. Leaf264]KQO98513.1 hypothetical protein ASF30_10655 [Leifsonia sp. Leaf264]